MIRSIRLQLTFWYIGSISLLILLFGGSVFFSFKTILVRNIDQMLYTGGKTLDEKLSEHTLKDEKDPRSLYEPADDEHDMLVDTIDEETNDIFFAREVYVQLVEFPKDDETVPQVIIKTETLNDFVLPFSQKTYLGSRAEPFFAETVLALNDVFFEVFEDMHLLAKQKKLTIEFQEIEQVHIKGDPGLLKRLFVNLLLNAIQYTTSGGKMTFSLHKETSHAVLTVTDTGIGVPEEALPYIFDRFYRVDQSRSHETGGSGLGLAIAQKIIEIHGGEITVQSTVGQGTTFRVCLPCLL